ncbi:exonuclease [Candidatus Scalindua japonica]|uniref:Exonuclease n=1 Tax=Candidatus Scalindua japonica TaxID=1284222 RepID=A0A286U4I3_9BACT|nr:MBL fold metallo-hydrolase [Candidatus Scalindua japonica]GAX63035.1 exonuclease [Candidatus Scalindua japonica]
MKITFVGATRIVTGSCFHIQTKKTHLLIDCGLFQGTREHEQKNAEPFPFKPSEVDYLLLTHAHLDHTGLIPKLVKEGFQGKILTTKATVELCNVMLLDSAHIHEREAEWENKKRMRAGKHLLQPLYTTDDATYSLQFFQGVDYNEIVDLENSVKVRFQDAGHILGSASLELWIKEENEEKKLVFSGDIGQKDLPIVKDPTPIEEADYVFTESTYGNRKHKSIDETEEEFRIAVSEALKRGGNVIIPAFAVGRTQNILYILKQLTKEGKLNNLKVFVDSPMAIQATNITLNHPECFDEETLELVREGKLSGRGLFLVFTETADESRQINKTKSGAIIISASGMCNAGRIRHHLKHNLWRPECSVIFVGYQAQGTLGRRIIEGAEEVKIFGEEISVKAKIYTIGGFSAHADQEGLIDWLSNFKKKPERIFVMHGEEETAVGFAETIKKQLHVDAYAPFCMEEMTV